MSKKYIKKTVSKILMRFFFPQQLNQRISRSIDVQNFFNFLKIENYVNVDNASDIIFEKITDFSNFIIFDVFTLLLTKSFSQRQLNLKFVHFQSQNYKRAKISNQRFRN